MAQARKIYRKCKVWADVDDSGRLIEQRGLVKIRYRKDDPEAYSAKVSEVSDLDPAEEAASKSAESRGDGAAPAPPKRPRAPRKLTAKSKASAADRLVIHTDGSCFGNPGPAGIGVLMEWKGKTKEISKFLGEGTNNIAELTAIQVGLQEVKNRRVPVRIHTDSAYAIGVLSEGWKVKENRELVARIQALMRDFADLAFVKVRGHSGDPGNERVDLLARDAIMRRS
jgi:ribonuclease HI